MTSQTRRNRALEVARRQGIARGRDFGAASVPRVYLQRLRKEGIFQQIGRCLYNLANAEVTSASSLAEAARIQPKGSWPAVGAAVPQPHDPDASRIRACGEVLRAGIETHQIGGVPVPIKSPAKTVADCFKHRNKVGLDVAIEALRDFIKSRKGRAGLNELWR
ncbi:MAG TPA: type IV toxin-antitoxin system AbiEi family antitoxin domain-containing protein [Bosea sp. (in: a-proteobacteria)]|jgi:hypothetical protein|nr:type IV toxin-antitoxin system AbiEi family antitoxin domain-containing protein [Bosea sp. (in: a-proteobacteria)]